MWRRDNDQIVAQPLPWRLGNHQWLIKKIEPNDFFQNKLEELEGMIVSSKSSGSRKISGSFSWNKEGRHYRLETCTEDSNEDCFLWIESDPNLW